MTSHEPTLVTLAPDADHAAAALLLPHLRAGAVVIDAAAVERLTLPCAQVILAALGSGEPPLLRAPSAAFRSGWEALGLDWNLVAGCIAALEPVSEPMSEPAAAAATDTATRVLTIDDSRTIRQMLLLTLKDAGFEVVQAEDGEEGVALLAREPIDFVITDINMPRMDGYGVIRRMRADPQHRATPVLVLTTESELGNKDLARDLGASGWIVKPFDPERLVAAIHAVTAARPQPEGAP